MPGARASSERYGAYADLAELIKLKHQATGFTFLPRQPIHSVLSGKHASRLRGRGLNFEEIRHYLPGDDIRTIDWKVTVRTGEPHVRSYTEERDRPSILVVDQRLCMFFGSGVRMKSVTAAEATAVGAWRSLSQGDRVGAVAFDDQRLVDVRPHRSSRTVMRILNEVVELNHGLSLNAAGRTSPGMLNAALERVLRMATHDCLVTLITDGTGADDETVRLATLLSEHNDLILLLVYDPLEVHLPDAGSLVVSEESLQLEVDTSDARLRERFHQAFQDRLARIRDVSRRRRIPVLPLSTTEGVAEQARRLLGHRPRAGGTP